MRVITGRDNVDVMLSMYSAVRRGVETNPRGTKTKNVHNLVAIFDAATCPLTSFAHRKLNLDYCKKEWLWYLGADKFDDSIEQHASLWAKIKQPDGSYYSNYGQYLFAQTSARRRDWHNALEPKYLGLQVDQILADRGEEMFEGPDGHTYVRSISGSSQFEYVVKTLKDDPSSRRASLSLLKREHLFEENKDVVCTYAINFTIEAKKLHMTVHMRSNDVIYGFTNDAFCFWHLYLYVYTVLKHHMSDLKTGTYTHMANSMHVYDRHYSMISDIVYMGRAGYVNVPIPVPTATEVLEIFRSRGKKGSGEHYEWLTH
jgi:thymidylate synthase